MEANLLCLHLNNHACFYRDSWQGSGVYKWRNGFFQLYQNISTREARAWKHFTINSKVQFYLCISFILCASLGPQVTILPTLKQKWVRTNTPYIKTCVLRRQTCELKFHGPRTNRPQERLQKLKMVPQKKRNTQKPL